jgi:hypothetical protein
MKELKRICPKCGDEIIYKTKSAFYAARKKNSTCFVCRNKNLIGENNPFYGKKHSKESKEKYIQSRKDGYNNHKYKSKEYRDKQSKLNSGENNNMYGKTFYDVWLKKYGKDIADEKMKNLKEKHSKNNSGVNNPMYGKPSPIGSGNGWSGWYKGWYFRSLLELSYMINVIERYNIKWESGEKKKYQIKYNVDGKIKNYYPDFILENKYIVELKPKKLYNTIINKAKKESALSYCDKNGYIYKMRTPKKLNKTEILKLYNSDKIKFLDRYKEKLLEYIKNN